jgi:hypothetical protein
VQRADGELGQGEPEGARSLAGNNRLEGARLMAQEERYGTRDQTYNEWHRRLSTQRFIGIENAQLLALIDADGVLWVEYEDGTKEPIALIEVAKDVGQSYKTATVIRNLAKRCQPVMPAFVVLYTSSNDLNPAKSSVHDISKFRVKCIWPKEWEHGWMDMSPQEYAEFLLMLRTESCGILDKRRRTSPIDLLRDHWHRATCGNPWERITPTERIHFVCDILGITRRSIP